jgi:hypothetical protein
MKKKIFLEAEIASYLRHEIVWEWLVNHGNRTVCSKTVLFGLNGTCECREMGYSASEIKGSKYRKICFSCRIGQEKCSLIREKIYSESFKEEVIEKLLPILAKAFMKYVSHITSCGNVYIPHYFMENHRGIHYRFSEAVKENKAMYEKPFSYIEYCPFSYLMGKSMETLFVNINSGEIEQIFFPVQVNGYPLFECLIIAMACPEVMIEEILEVKEKTKPVTAPAPAPDDSVYYSNVEADNEANFCGFFND